MKIEKYVFLAWYHNKNSNVDIFFDSKEFYNFEEMEEYLAEHAEQYSKYAKKDEKYYSKYFTIKQLF